MMQFLLARTGSSLPEPAPSRGIITEQDARTAVLLLAAAIDESAQGGEIPPRRAEHMAEMLMLVREYIQPLPVGTGAEGGPDLVSADLQEAVEELRRESSRNGIRG